MRLVSLDHTQVLVWTLLSSSSWDFNSDLNAPPSLFLEHHHIITSSSKRPEFNFARVLEPEDVTVVTKFDKMIYIHPVSELPRQPPDAIATT